MTALLVFGVVVPCAASVGFMLGLHVGRCRSKRAAADAARGPLALEGQLRRERAQRTDRG